MPLALDVDVAGFGDPAPLMTAQLTVTPATGLLNPSATRTDSGVGSGCPTVPVWRSPPFTLICVAGATQMRVNGGDRQTGTVGQPLPTPLSVRVADGFNNPVAGVTVSWAVISGAGSPNPATSTSNASGIASTTWTLGTRRTATDSVQLAQATGVGSPLTFTAFAVPGAVNASQTSVVASPAALTASNGTSASTVTVTARDQYGNPVRGRTVTLAATGTANAIVQPRDTTDPNGVATGSLSSTFAEAKVVSA